MLRQMGNSRPASLYISLPTDISIILAA